MRVGVKPGQWGWSFEDLVACWRAAELAGFDLVSCFDHVSAAPAGLTAWDAPSLLVAMAGVTDRVALSVDVLNTSLRNPFLLAGQLAVAQAASGGRVEVGLGAGSYHLARYDHGALGVPFPAIVERRRRLLHCCRVFPALWRGEKVSDEELGLDQASLGQLEITPPPIIVGGVQAGTIEIAANEADGWNASVGDAATFARLAGEVESVCRRQGRKRPLQKNAQVFVRDINLARGRHLIADLEAAGADSVTFILVEERGPAAVETLAEAVL
jgi:alkanesulfonate monooxygenase SsuD/methylene tetrahydromethanopterin reductase-like flavin-dependent oxidoreductase (luciferase family)